MHVVRMFTDSLLLCKILISTSMDIHFKRKQILYKLYDCLPTFAGFEAKQMEQLN